MVKRLLVIEDNERRVGHMRHWCPEGVTIVHVKEGGVALRMIELDAAPGTYIGVCLDHDLDLQAHGYPVPGRDVAERMVRNWRDRPPVLVHSMNPGGAAGMMHLLSGAGFPVTRIPMADLTEKKFREWVLECLEDAA